MEREVENSEINSGDKGLRTYIRKTKTFSTMVLLYLHYRKMTLGSLLLPWARVNSKCIKDLVISPKTPWLPVSVLGKDFKKQAQARVP